MADEHGLFCDRTHTGRQPCNRNRDPDVADAVLLATEDEAVVTDAASNVVEAGAVVTEARLAAIDAATEPRVVVPEYLSDVVHTETRKVVAEPVATAAVVAGLRESMPAPSPWAVRAWEDTAAAVGAAAPAAAPVREAADIADDSDSTAGVLAGRAPLILGFAGAAALAFIVARRMRG